MKPRWLLVLAAGLMVAGAAWWLRPNRPAVRPAAPAAAARPEVGPNSAPANRSADRIKLDLDPAAVFQRAFWRRPGPGDKILHGERRDWVDASAAVQQWQWFVAVAPSPEFRRWLLEENPFELAATTSSSHGTAAAPAAPPAWFPPSDELAGFAQYRTRGGRLTVFYDPKSNRIFATDTGSGFAAASR